MILRARVILPLADAPIENGAIVIKDGRIDWIGRWRECIPLEHHKVHDLGEVALFPGLINAHCHLDYTSMAGKIPAPKYFPDWVKIMLSFKSHWSCSEFAESWLSGAKMLLNGGVTTVADIESVPELLPQVWEATPLRVISCLEMTGVKNQRLAGDVLGETLGIIDHLPNIDRKHAALSPHSLYATQPDLIRASVQTAAERQFRLTTHLSESESEFQMFCDGKGPFFDWLKGQRKMDDCGKGSPVRLAHEYRLLSPTFLAVHVNYLAPGDAEIIGRSGTHVAHCPRSHEYFGHDPFPYESLIAVGTNIALGTDSLASIRKTGGQAPELSLWEEMRSFAASHPGVGPKEIFGMVTQNAARALGMEDRIGTLKPGFAADVIAKTHLGPVHEKRLLEELLHSGSVREVFIGGELVKPE